MKKRNLTTESEVEDRRPEPKPRKNARLWQAYLWWDELVQMRKKHLLRMSSAERGKSQMDIEFEQAMIDVLQLDALVDPTNKAQREVSPESVMIDEGRKVGEIWEWLTSIKGLAAGGLAAQLIAQIDDIGKFATVSKLWRFCGYAVIDGEIDHPTKGEKLHYNARLKSLLFLIVEQFVRQQTQGYSGLYYDEKERQARLHSTPQCSECDGEIVQGKNGGGHSIWRCAENAKHRVSFTPAHLDARAKRKVAKIFLQHLWVKWRESDGLPVTGPYVQDMMGHEHIV